MIDAFNRDLPYDQFIREQLAGDLLDRRPDPLVRPNANDDAATKNLTGDTGRPDQGVRPTVTSTARDGVIATGYIALARRFGSRVLAGNA